MDLMDPEFPYTKLKILFVNIFFVLYKAASLNLNKLDLHIREVNLRLQFTDRTIAAYLLRMLISLFLLSNFIVGYCSMAANVVSVFPILTDEQPELLLPTLVMQLVEYVGLTMTEFALGYIMVKYILGDCSSFLMPFAIRLVAKTIIGLSVLNMYANFYIELTVHQQKHKIIEDLESEEKLIKKEDLS